MIRRIKRVIYGLSVVIAVVTIALQGVVVYAYAEEEEKSPIVDAVWSDGNTQLLIKLTDAAGNQSDMTVDISEYGVDSEYITIQAVDYNGTKSNTVKVKNPCYEPKLSENENTADTQTTAESQSSVSNSEQSSTEQNTTVFTPAGGGAVLDDAIVNDKEFFTINTPNNSVFYMIVDRARPSDNVYLLNSVTEQDLLPFTQDAQSASPEPEPTQAATPTPEPIPEPESTPEPKDNGMNYTIIIIVVILVGGAGYYFKVHKKKQNVVYDEEQPEGDAYDEHDDVDEDEGFEIDSDEDELQDENSGNISELSETIDTTNDPNLLLVAEDEEDGA